MTELTTVTETHDEIVDLRIEPELVLARERVRGKRLAIVHYGEHTPFDAGYRPARMGLLARWLTEAGAHVTRFVPTFSPFANAQRTLRWTGNVSAEGDLVMIPTRGFKRSRSIDRLGNIRDLARGTARAISAESVPYDLLIAGYPPPGVVGSVHAALDGRLPIVADLRDLWPDALMPSDNPYTAALAKLVGTALANELRLTEGVVASSPELLERAPSSRRLGVIPIGLTVTDLPPMAEVRDGPMVALFVGSLSPLFDFESMVEGWRRFLVANTSGNHVLRIVGDGDRRASVEAFVDGVQGIEMVGWIPSDQVPSELVRADIGCHPVRAGQGSTIGNKGYEYLSAGLHILHSLGDGPARGISSYGSQVASNPNGWARAFAKAHANLTALRKERPQRIRAAHQEFGRPRIELMWLNALNQALESGERNRALGSHG